MTPDPGDLDRIVRTALEEDLRYPRHPDPAQYSFDARVSENGVE